MTRRRIALVRERMRELGIDAFIASALPGVRYLTGFSGTSGVCVVRRRDVVFLSDSRYVLQAKAEVKGCRTIIAANGLYEEAARCNLFKGCRSVGFDSHTVTYAQYRTLKKVAAAVSFVPTTDVVESVALVKEKMEIGLLRDAVRISDKVFDEVVRMIKPGVAELDIAGEICYLHRKYGAEKDAFDPIVASGARGSLPHARASSKRIRHGEMVTLDFGCTVSGYNSDITRTVAVGRASTEQRRMYAAVLDAQSQAIDAARAGMWAKDLDAIARRRIAREGYGDYFRHSLGHGIGLQVHERPRVSSSSKDKLAARSVITIEPGIYVPGVGGVRIEDDVLLTTTGCEVLNTAPKEFMIV